MSWTRGRAERVERQRKYRAADGGPVIRTYRGFNIHPCERNTAGMQWWAVVGCRNLRADTLEGIKSLIREHSHG